ncbi:hypothetical protein ABW21_db0207242 [Orbilia brochopaga]|nr:hypothetical protein ABW21_db0207242 [Drechslerella brochopaga]
MSAEDASSGHKSISADGSTKRAPRHDRTGTPPPPTLIERTNALPLDDLKARFLDTSITTFTRFGDDDSQTSYSIELYTSSSLPDETFNDCFDLLEANMSTSYRATSKGWSPRKKKEEMKHPAMRYLILTATAPEATFIGFLEFMITEEEGSEVIYTYELDIIPSQQKLGLGKCLLEVAEEFGKRVGVEKAMLTVFDSNKGARRFYEREGYDLDEISPEPKILRSGLVKPPTFHILSKPFENASSMEAYVAC